MSHRSSSPLYPLSANRSIRNLGFALLHWCLGKSSWKDRPLPSHDFQRVCIQQYVVDGAHWEYLSWAMGRLVPSSSLSCSSSIWSRSPVVSELESWAQKVWRWVISCLVWGWISPIHWNFAGAYRTALGKFLDIPDLGSTVFQSGFIMESHSSLVSRMAFSG